MAAFDVGSDATGPLAVAVKMFTTGPLTAALWAEIALLWAETFIETTALTGLIGGVVAVEAWVLHANVTGVLPCADPCACLPLAAGTTELPGRFLATLEAKGLFRACCVPAVAVAVGAWLP